MVKTILITGQQMELDKGLPNGTTRILSRNLLFDCWEAPVNGNATVWRGLSDKRG